MEEPERQLRWPLQRTRWLLALVLFALVFSLLIVIAVSPLPMRGAEVFGVLVNKVKGHPGATAFWAFTGLGLLWAAIAMLTGIQEWLAVRRKI